MEKLTVIIADDHPIIRIGVKMLLERTFDLTFYEASDGDELFELAKEHKSDVVLMDINMPGTHTQNILQNLLSFNPSLNVIMFSMNKEEIYGKLFMQLGAKAYIEKDCLQTELVKVVKSVSDGNIYVKQGMQGLYFGKNGNHGSPYVRLSKKELEILQFLAKGYPLKTISETMNLSPSTIGTHKAHIFDKLRVSNNIELLNYISLYPLN